MLYLKLDDLSRDPMQLPQPALELFKFTVFCWGTARCPFFKFVS